MHQNALSLARKYQPNEPCSYGAAIHWVLCDLTKISSVSNTGIIFPIPVAIYSEYINVRSCTIHWFTLLHPGKQRKKKSEVGFRQRGRRRETTVNINLQLSHKPQRPLTVKTTNRLCRSTTDTGLGSVQ